jgi:beta-glucosidase/6-phospho-beta-glucosidase/beta-galactosidase
LHRDEYAQFSEFCFKIFADRVKYWMAFNEPRVVATLGYENGMFSHGRFFSPFGNHTTGNFATEPYILAHNLLLSHSMAVKIYRERYQVRPATR